MRYSYLAPLALGAIALACNDGPTSLDNALQLAGGGGNLSLTATQTASGLWERRVEYDWTGQRYVKEIHAGLDMHLIPETDRVQILPGETLWITFQVDAQRSLASTTTVEGVRGQTCVTNTGRSAVSGFVVVEQVMAVVNGNATPVAGATTTLRDAEKLEAGATRCLDYEILFDAQPGVAYRVVAVVAADVGGRTVAQKAADFSLPSQMETVEIDAQAWVRDGWMISCANTFGQHLDFTCAGLEWPQDRLLEANEAGHASTSFMVDFRNDGVCEKTFVVTFSEPIREGGPGPAGGEIRNVTGTLTITTPRCEDLTTCPKSDEWWAALAVSNPDAVFALLPVTLGQTYGDKTVVPTNVDGVRNLLNRFGEPSNGIMELYAQQMTAKFNIRVGADPRPYRDLRIAVDNFLAANHARDWLSLSAAEQAQVWRWAEQLEALNEGGCPGEPQGDGCTRTIGYWKNHAGFGPQADVVTPLLPVWLGTATGAKSVSVTSAARAVELLDKSGDASNGINKLYAQLLAAKLNIASGANGSAISQTIAQADAFLATHAAADWHSLSAAERQSVLTWASTLDDYNNGKIGPGHCN